MIFGSILLQKTKHLNSVFDTVIAQEQLSYCYRVIRKSLKTLSVVLTVKDK